MSTFQPLHQAKMSNHLVLKGSTYHVRLDIPEDVRASFGGRKVLTKSLGTGNKAEAQSKKHAYLAQWKAQIIEARARNSSHEWREFVQNAAHQLKITEIEARDLIFNGESKDEGRSLENSIQDVTDMLVNDVRSGRISADEAERVQDELLDILSRLAATADEFDAARVLAGLSNWSKSYYSQRAANVFKLSGDLSEELHAIVTDPASYKPKSPFTASRLERFERYELIHLHNKPKTVSQKIERLKLISAYLQSNGLELSHDAIAAFLDSLEVHPKTKSQYLLSGRSFHKWASKNEQGWKAQYGKENPFSQHDLPSTKGQANGSYEAFTKDEVVKLHQQALLNQDEELADLIEIAAYTGCRLEEIGCIRKTSVTLQDSKPISFTITQAKTEAGNRDLPIHPEISKIFSRRLETGRTAYLFDGKESKNGTRIDALGKRFGRLKTGLGFSTRHVFHSIRKTFGIELLNLETDPVWIQKILGHKSETVTFDIYATHLTMNNKRSVIDRISYGFH